MDEQEQAALGEAIARAGELADEGNLTAAMRTFAVYPFTDEDIAVAPFTDEDIAVADGAGYFEAAGRYVPALFNFFKQFREYEGPLPDDPAVLGAISAPVLMLHGANTKPFLVTSARYVAGHDPNARIQAIPGAGHASPLTHPGALAKALTEFFSPKQQPV